MKMIWTMLLFAVVASPAWAVELATLFTAEVPFDQDARDPRAKAYRAALDVVLLRVSGSQLVADNELVDALFPRPAAYVVQFRQGEEDTLWVSFDGDAVEETLRRSGQTVWGADRPLTLVWLAVDWGQGRREIIAADDPTRGRDQARTIDRNRLLRQRVLDRAEYRGIPVVLPLVDTIDRQSLGFSDIWGGFDEAVIAASARYEADAILVGRVRATSSQRNRWSFFLGGDEFTYTGEPESVIDLVANRLAEEFSISGTAAREQIDVTISGITSVDAYGSVQNLLTSTTVIEEYSIVEAQGDRIRFRVQALGGIDRLRRALRFGGLIEENGAVDDLPGIEPIAMTLNFAYSP